MTIIETEIETQHVPSGIFKQVRHFHIGSFFLMKQLQPHYLDLAKKIESRSRDHLAGH